MKIELYSKKNCMQCDATVLTLEGMGVTYETIKVDEDREALEFVKSLGYMSAPVIVLRDGHQVITSWSGFKPDQLSEL